MTWNWWVFNNFTDFYITCGLNMRCFRNDSTEFWFCCACHTSINGRSQRWMCNFDGTVTECLNEWTIICVDTNNWLVVLQPLILHFLLTQIRCDPFFTVGLNWLVVWFIVLHEITFAGKVWFVVLIIISRIVGKISLTVQQNKWTNGNDYMLLWMYEYSDQRIGSFFSLSRWQKCIPCNK